MLCRGFKRGDIERYGCERCNCINMILPPLKLRQFALRRTAGAPQQAKGVRGWYGFCS